MANGPMGTPRKTPRKGPRRAATGTRNRCLTTSAATRRCWISLWCVPLSAWATCHQFARIRALHGAPWTRLMPGKAFHIGTGPVQPEPDRVGQPGLDRQFTVSANTLVDVADFTIRSAQPGSSSATFAIEGSPGGSCSRAQRARGKRSDPELEPDPAMKPRACDGCRGSPLTVAAFQGFRCGLSSSRRFLSSLMRAGLGGHRHGTVGIAYAAPGPPASGSARPKRS